MKTILLELIFFLKNPYSQISRILSRKEKFQYLLWLGLLLYLVNIVIGIIVVIEKYFLAKYGFEIKAVDFNINP